MLKPATLVLQSGVEAALIAGVIVMYLRGTRQAEKGKWLLRGVLVALLLASAWVYGPWPREIRKNAEGYLLLASSLAQMGLLVWIWLRRASSGAGVMIMTTAALLPKAIELTAVPTRIYIQTPGFLNTELIEKVSGGVLGLLVVFFLGLTLVNAGERAGRKGLLAGSTLILGAAALWQVIGVLKTMFQAGLLPITDLALEIMVPLLNKQMWFFSVGLGGAAAVILIAGFSRSILTGAEAANPAQKRKQRARIRGEIRWVQAAAVVLVVMVSLLAFGSSASGKKVTLSPPTPVSPAGDSILIPVEKVNDGQLHRFGYQASDGKKVRFIVIRKGNGGFGIGLDACNICGPTGYYQRGKDVVCINCDVVMNIATIGFKGGCNPIPLQYTLQDGQIVIPVEKLEEASPIFR